MDKNYELMALKDLKSKNQLFEKLLSSQLSKNKIEEGKIIYKITKITENLFLYLSKVLKVNL